MVMKYFRRKKVQTVIIFINVVLATMLINGSVSVILNKQAPVERLVKECSMPELVVNTTTTDIEEVRKICSCFQRIGSVAQATVYRKHQVKEKVKVGNRDITTPLDLTEYWAEYSADEAFGKLRKIEGDLNIKEYNVTDCALPACVAYENDIRVGDTISIFFLDMVRNYRVKGIYANPESMSTAKPTKMFVRKYQTGLESQYCISIKMKHNFGTAAVEKIYRNAHRGMLSGVMLKSEDIAKEQMQYVNILGCGIFVLGLGALLVSVLIVVFWIRNTVLIDSKKIAIYKTCGYSQKTILRFYLVYYFGVVSMSAVVGVLISQAFSMQIMNSLLRNIGDYITINILHPGWVVCVMVVSIVMISIYLVVRKTASVKPVYAIKGDTSLRVGVKGTNTINNLSFHPFTIALRLIFKDKKGTVGVLITAVSIVLLVNIGTVSLGIANRMEEDNDFWLGIPSCEVVVDITDPRAERKARSIAARSPGVEDVVPWIMEYRVLLPWKAEESSEPMYAGVYKEFDDEELPVLEGRNPLTGEEIALSSKMAKEMNKKVGDYINVSLDGKQESTLLVTGIFQTYYEMGRYCRLHVRALIQRDISAYYDKLAVYVKADAEKEEVIKYLEVMLGSGCVVKPREELFQSIMHAIALPQKNAIPPITLLVLLIGSISIFSIVLLRSKKNERNLQIYKSLGYNIWDLYSINVWYVVILTSVAILIELPILLFCYSKMMTLALSAFALREYKVSFEPMEIILINALILVLFVISAVIASRGMRKLHMKDIVTE